MTAKFYKRHCFAWVSPMLFANASNYILSNKEYKDDVIKWIKSGLPLIMTNPKSPKSYISLGLSLLNGKEKIRICLDVDINYIIGYMPAPALELLSSILKSKWFFIEKLLSKTKELGTDLYTYGSYAWEYVSGIGYVDADSDIDIFFKPNDNLEKVLELLMTYKSLLNLDGEICFTDNSAVCWHEYYLSKDKVLVKMPYKAYLESKEKVLNTKVLNTKVLNTKVNI